MQTHFMNIKIALVAILALGGCSSGSSGGSSPGGGTSQSFVGGIFRGKVASASGTALDSLLIVSDDGRFISMAEDPATHCAQVAQGSLVTSGTTFTGGGNFGEIDYTTVPTVQSDCAAADGSVWGTSDVSGSFVARTSLQLSATNTTSLGTTLTGSPITYTYDTLYDESSDLSKTVGDWTDQTGTVISVDGNGVIYSLDANTGCELNGTLSLIDPQYNAYSATVSFSNCQAGAADLNGDTAVGLVALNDTVVPNELYIGYTLTMTSGESLIIATVATR
jgi:hypothetical protein